MRDLGIFLENARCIGLGESSFQFFAYFGTSCVSALGGLQALQGTHNSSVNPFCSCSPGSASQTPGEEHGAVFLLTNPNATSVSSDSSNTRVKKDPEQSGVWMEGSCCKMLPRSCQAQAGTWKEIYILLITMVISHKHKFKE